ncbi:MAG: hypothetical protein F6K19_17000 [Cyanothece sp. SIO1E1]|nr:hypothetical protein [Cyanothece sp. SIO1E1]
MRLLSLCLLTVLLVLGGAIPAWGNAISQADLDATVELWQGSAHALNDVNCSSCHQDTQDKTFMVYPTQETCQSCHEQAVDTFMLGKHGIRLLEGGTPLTPKLARLPMQAAAHDLQMTCNTCHDVHEVNTVQASVDSCLTCHSDAHSLNYQNSRHAELFIADSSLPRPSGSAVSCASCHLPRHVIKQADGGELTLVNHNNTFTLKPRDRMVKEVCMNCHSVEYSYNSIFDDALVETNFDRPPSLSLETFDLVRALEARRSARK